MAWSSPNAMKIIMVFLFKTTLLMSLMVEASPASEQLTLLAFKERVTQDSLGALNSWNSSLHFCSWKGVTCNKNQRVTVLNLESQSLVGSISPHIGNLSFLTTINLENNSFYGQIPQEVGRLFNLRELLLSNNSFGGEIPFTISNSSNLVNLHLSSNNFSGNIPPELGSLSKLVMLQFRRNMLTGRIPPSLGNMSSLQHLTLNFNEMEGSIPDSIGHMPSLQYIRIGLNKFSGTIPSSIWNHSSLKELYVGYNQLQGSIPVDIGLTLPIIENFLIPGNNFSGTIPDSLTNMTRLDYIDLAENNFVGPITTNFGAFELLHWVELSSNHFGSGHEKDLNFVNSLINCSQLDTLSLNDNRFGGVLPETIANLSTKLLKLELDRNEIYGSIPIGIANLVNLTHFSMEQNLLSGPIPSAIGNIRELKRLNLFGNKLSGEIPPSIGDISGLYDLHLQNNNLTGRIPLSLGSFHRLQRLDLSQNRLSGTIPEEVIGPSILLSHLNLSRNSLTGTVPFEVGNLRNLEVLDVSENNLSGKIPSTLGQCWKLEQVYMGGNKIDGSLRPLEKLKSVQYVDVSRNNFSGPIPKEFEEFQFLQGLNLSFNDLQGELPKGGIFRNVSATLIAGNKKLCGGIPEFHLPTCLTQASKNRRRSLLLKLMMPIVIVTLITIFLVTYWRIKSYPSSTSLVDWYSKYSYEELFNATNGFEQARLIGSGSFGSVYKGILDKDETPVAIKVLNLQHRGASKSFIAEYEALKNIRHRNLLKILDACSTVDYGGNDFKALVYRFMSNGSLEDWLHPCGDDGQKKARILSFGQRLRIAIDIALALEYLHYHCETPVVHCDLKPSNVLLDDDLTAHVGDFGLVKFLSTNQNLRKDEASTLAIKGSIGYVAPEYGAGGKVSTSGDVYSYGILLLEMFTGKRPTDEMFKDSVSIHSFSKMALPDRVMEIVDTRMFSGEECDEGITIIEIERDMENIMQQCMLSMFRIGVACSTESQVGRMNIKDVIVELNLIKDFYHGDGIQSRRHRFNFVKENTFSFL